MTNEEKSRISEMRKQGYTYAKIAEMLSIPRSTIKTYCRRTQTSDDTAIAKPVCKQCGQPITVKAKCKPRQFCSDNVQRTKQYKGQLIRQREKEIKVTHSYKPRVKSTEQTAEP